MVRERRREPRWHTKVSYDRKAKVPLPEWGVRNEKIGQKARSRNGAPLTCASCSWNSARQPTPCGNFSLQEGAVGLAGLAELHTGQSSKNGPFRSHTEAGCRRHTAWFQRPQPLHPLPVCTVPARRWQAPSQMQWVSIPLLLSAIPPSPPATSTVRLHTGQSQGEKQN